MNRIQTGMLPIFELFAGGPLGTGKQWVSAAHAVGRCASIDDTASHTRSTHTHKHTRVTHTRQMSWIHRDDLVDLMIEALTNPSYTGAYNGTAPKPVTMAQLCSSVGGAVGRPRCALFACRGWRGAPFTQGGQLRVPRTLSRTGIKKRRARSHAAYKHTRTLTRHLQTHAPNLTLQLAAGARVCAVGAAGRGRHRRARGPKGAAGARAGAGVQVGGGRGVAGCWNGG
jgi:hypothetical protein